jgi:predicted  nucleic acid-binding Zn-ribbon protein
LDKGSIACIAGEFKGKMMGLCGFIDVATGLRMSDFDRKAEREQSDYARGGMLDEIAELERELDEAKESRDKLLSACRDSLDLLAHLIGDRGLPITPKVAKLRNDLCAAIADAEGQIAEAEGGGGE